jgi:hypothetical protein
MAYKLIAGLLVCCSVQAAEPPWDLSYRSVLRDRPVADREMGAWIGAAPKRPIHQQLATYAGAPIEASLLLEQPAPIDGGIATTWLVATHDGAQLCVYGKVVAKQSCQPFDRARAEGVIREASRLREPPQPDAKRHKPQDDNYIGLLSLYIDGKATQRPLMKVEWIDCDAEAHGRSGKMKLPVILERLQLSDAEIADRERDEQRDRAANPGKSYPSRMCPAQ